MVFWNVMPCSFTDRYEGSPILKVQAFFIHDLLATSRCHLHILVHRVKMAERH
jgi:hypothetical protein